MAGRKPSKVFLYDGIGNFVRDFESIAEFARTFNFTKNLFSAKNSHKEDIFEFADGRVAALSRIGRIGVRKFKEYRNSPYVGQGKTTANTVYKNRNKGKVKIYDLDGDLIAEFKSLFQLCLMTSIDRSSLSHLGEGREKIKTREGLIIEVEPYGSTNS